MRKRVNWIDCQTTRAEMEHRIAHGISHAKQNTNAITEKTSPLLNKLEIKRLYK